MALTAYEFMKAFTTSSGSEASSPSQPEDWGSSETSRTSKSTRCLVKTLRFPCSRSWADFLWGVILGHDDK